MRYSLRTLALIVTGIAAVFALLRYPSEMSALLVTSCSAIVLLAAAALAIGTAQPARSFWLGLLVVSLGARHLESEKPLLFEDFRPVSKMLAGWLADRLLPGMLSEVGEPNSTDYRLSRDGRWVHYAVRGASGRTQNLGAMSESAARNQGIQIASLTRVADTESLENLVRELLIAAIGVLGALLAYAAAKRRENGAAA